MKYLALILTLYLASCSSNDGRYKNWGNPPNPSTNNAHPGYLPGYWSYYQGKKYWVPPTIINSETQKNIYDEQQRGTSR